MPAPSPPDLIRQARQLISQHAAPSPAAQADLRRAISSAYYAVFHFTLIALADLFVGSDVASRASLRYQLVYRSIDHKLFKTLCEEATKQTASKRWASYVGISKTGIHIGEYAKAVTVLQDARHEADYDPLANLNPSDVGLMIDMANVCMTDFAVAAEDERRMFLTVLLCPPRG
jgi:hypothetical protein